MGEEDINKCKFLSVSLMLDEGVQGVYILISYLILLKEGHAWASGQSVSRIKNYNKSNSVQLRLKKKIQERNKVLPSDPGRVVETGKLQ